MICYKCAKASECPTFRKLYTMSKDFCINDCKDYDGVSNYKYRVIAANDGLMRLIYDYFMGQVEVDGYTDDDIKEIIRYHLMDM